MVAEQQRASFVGREHEDQTPLDEEELAGIAGEFVPVFDNGVRHLTQCEPTLRAPPAHFGVLVICEVLRREAAERVPRRPSQHQPSAAGAGDIDCTGVRVGLLLEASRPGQAKYVRGKRGEAGSSAACTEANRNNGTADAVARRFPVLRSLQPARPPMGVPFTDLAPPAEWPSCRELRRPPSRRDLWLMHRGGLSTGGRMIALVSIGCLSA